MAVNDVSFLSSTYWLVSFGMFVLGLYAVGTDRIDMVNNNNPYIMAMILSPIPLYLVYWRYIKAGKREIWNLNFLVRRQLER